MWFVTPEGYLFTGVALAHANRYPRTSGPDDTTHQRFGDDLEAYIADRRDWMHRAGFNAFSYTTPEHAGVDVPWVATLPLMPGFINVGPRGFDPFDPVWRRQAEETIARELPPLLRDPRVMGVSLSYPVMASPHVVPQWMWARLDREPTNLLRELKALGSDAPGKRAYIDYLRARYGTVSAFAQARGIRLEASDFDALLAVDLGAGESPWELHADDADFYTKFWTEAVAHAITAIRRFSASIPIFSPRVIGLRKFPDAWLDAWLRGVGDRVDVYVPELYGNHPYQEIVTHIGRLTGRPSFVADGMRPCEFNYASGLEADRTEAARYREMFETLLASPWFLGGTVCEYRPRIPEFTWYAEDPAMPRSGVRRADYSERDPLFATFQEVHARKYRTRVALLKGKDA
ncbi:MAG TPA: hypothetical protein VL069_04380 [Opitutus sp.]|nr:hypothetical protein [Opitutus sp.]